MREYDMRRSRVRITTPALISFFKIFNVHLLLSTQVLNGYPVVCDRHCWSQRCRFLFVVGGGGGVIGAKIISAMDQSNQEVEVCGRLYALPYKLLIFSSHPQ